MTAMGVVRDDESEIRVPNSAASFGMGHFAAFIAIGTTTAVSVLFLQSTGLGVPTTTAMWLTAIAQVTGIAGINLILLQMLLTSRSPLLEKRIGLDSLVHWHKVLGKPAFGLVVAHVVFVIAGYAQTMQLGLIEQAKMLLFDTEGVLMAALAFVFLSLVVVSSVRRARQHIRRNTWQFIHFYAYLAIGLAFPHQLMAGTSFAGSTMLLVYWVLLYGLVIWSVVVYRVITPWRSIAFHGMRVESIEQESTDTYSVYITGRNLLDLQAMAGQFFIWRFMTKSMWFEGHPYSLSAAPRDNRLRITVKALGDGSANIATLKPGTRVFAEGPYGVFTPNQQNTMNALLIAGGIGITPIRAIAEHLQPHLESATLVYRAREREDLTFLSELRRIAHVKNIRLQIVSGSRHDFPATGQPLSQGHLRKLIRDPADVDVYLCGPAAMIDDVAVGCRAIGVPTTNIHFERFEM